MEKGNSSRYDGPFTIGIQEYAFEGVRESHSMLNWNMHIDMGY